MAFLELYSILLPLPNDIHSLLRQQINLIFSKLNAHAHSYWWWLLWGCSCITDPLQSNWNHPRVRLDAVRILQDSLTLQVKILRL